MNEPLKEKYLPSGPAGGRKPRILVAPLDWGLGHATRCIPVIQELISQHCEVWLAGEGAQQELLEQAFPDLPFLTLEGYRVRYSNSAGGLLWSMVRQTSQILSAIKKEKAWLRKMVKEHGFDGVISDNRYGLHHPGITCVFITHQLTIKTPFGKWTEAILRKRNYRYINRFTECWVPDSYSNDALAGELSHPPKKPTTPVIYTGPLSRFEKTDLPEKKDHLVVLLSGPEPQRTILENKIVEEISHYSGTATILRGLPGVSSILPSTGMLRFFNHLGTDALCKELAEAEFVICRSGYSSIMDIARLGKKSILIPTPGQTEQEYLAHYLSQKKLALTISQKDFSLLPSLQQARAFSYQSFSSENENALAQTISNFIARVIKTT